MRRTIAACLMAGAALLSAAGCKSARIDAVVENRTGQSINLLEVDYPSASFGADSLADGASLPYRFQLRGDGKLTVQYTESNSNAVRKVTGPDLKEGEQGHISIVLLPGGKVEFHPGLNNPR